MCSALVILKQANLSAIVNYSVWKTQQKIDRLIIGDSQMKGKGLCKQLINLLLDYGFNILHQPLIELNVFDWNAAAIRCYESAGLTRDPDKTMEFDMDGKKWIAFNMCISKLAYDQIKNKC